MITGRNILSLMFCAVTALLPVHLVQGQQSPVVANGAHLTEISDRFSFTEGPAADAEGNIYFTDQPNNDIWKYGIDGELSLFMDESGRSNGMYFDDENNLVTCADVNSELWKINPDKTVNVLVDNYRGKRLNGPNDLWIAPNGGIYLTDPYYQRDYWKRTEKEIEEERVYYLPPDRGELRIAADGLVKPNGIIGTPDGTKLYIADIGDQKTYSYRIAEDGSLTDRSLFADMGSDGMTIDENGNLYLTGDGVTVFNASGQQIEHIEVPGDWTANVTFGGPNRETLFITAGTAVYTIEMKVKGQ
ncbi:MAG: SMP-30/gluconolactonase/LRE family protein [Balneolaceae bacterium]|nr:SMP-30/gluconolactonase/LRE family protein [Balneolaceae bacterium]